MNKDQIKGSTRKLAGKVQAGVGRAIGNETQHSKGLGKQIAGKVQKDFGDLKEAVKNTAKR
ncbi:MAG TPA: CsbD family protein [Burkholderiaceae bacterium]